MFILYIRKSLVRKPLFCRPEWSRTTMQPANLSTVYQTEGIQAEICTGEGT